MSFRFHNVEYLTNSFIEVDRFDLAHVFNICYQILGSSFDTRQMETADDHILIFFNSDVSMYELILDCLKEQDICYSGMHDANSEGGDGRDRSPY